MHPFSTLSRIGLATAVAGLAGFAAAAPATAREAAPAHTWVNPTLPYLTNVPSDATKLKTIKVGVYNQTPLAARNVTMKIDITRLPERITAQLPGADQGCTVSGGVATCELAELAGGATHHYTMEVGPSGVEAGEWSGRISATSWAENTPGEQSTEALVQLTGPGIDLVIGDIDDVALAPGASTDVPIGLRNVGNVTADGVTVLLRAYNDHLELANSYSNCSYDPNYLELLCFFDQPVGPDETFVVDPATPLRLKVADAAPGPYTYGAEAGVAPLNAEELAQKVSAAKKAGGEQLRLIPATNKAARAAYYDLNTDDNTSAFTVTVPLHRADSIAVGATVNGASGRTETIKVGIRNAGPADTLGPDDNWGSSALITLPVGLTVRKVDSRCVPIVDGEPDWDQAGQPKGLVYRCEPLEDVAAGSTDLFAFTADSTGPAGAAGSIVVDGGVQDPDTANNTASISIVSVPVVGCQSSARSRLVWPLVTRCWSAPV
ncbi:hypothetical protein [Micromonospora sp. NBC_01796]|uniref:hypothetical protein n=1 Tax=Micromonospora sp. NBC_01796 TaxID=2975987 RepID=UPI002DD8051F|nr:hypothetical protein [Micromonospora sp. NBC_01796]WSA88192.1 hypothetical protein OIE47_11570 [Micromonospora sp. NBC_01796]